MRSDLQQVNSAALPPQPTETLAGVNMKGLAVLLGAIPKPFKPNRTFKND